MTDSDGEDGQVRGLTSKATRRSDALGPLCLGVNLGQEQIFDLKKLLGDTCFSKMCFTCLLRESK